MSDSTNSRDDQAPSFLQRWSRRKQEQAQAQQAEIAKRPVEQNKPEAAPEPASPRPIPDVDTLHENSEVSMFFTDQVSETLKRKALRKLFHMDKFNVCDGLDDYAEDYTKFDPLGGVMTAHQKLREQRESLNSLTNSETPEPEEESSTGGIEQRAEQDSNASAWEEQTADSDEPRTGTEHEKG